MPTAATQITLTSADDTYTAAAGDYIINGASGNDTITTGAGDSSVFTGFGNSTITTGAGSSIVVTGDGNQTITTGAGNSTVTTGIGNSTITTGAGQNVVVVGDGNNTVTLGAGDSSVTTGNGNQTITAGAGNDVIDVGVGNNIVTAAAGKDVLIYHAAGNQNTTSIFDGGTGIDTLRLVLTRAEWMSDAVQSDVDNYLKFLSAHTDASGEADTAAFTFTAFGLSATSIEKLQVTVDGVQIDPANHHVTLGNDVMATTEKVASLAFDVLANDSVPDLIKSFTYTNPSHGSLQVAAAYTDTASVPTAKFIYTPTPGFYDYLAQGETATDTFSYTVTDATGDVKTASVNVSIHGTNDAPTISASAPSQTLVEKGGGVSGTATSVVSLMKADIDHGDAANYDITGWTQLTATTYSKLGMYGSAVLNTTTNNLTYTLDNTNLATHALQTGTTVQDSFNVKVVDNFGASAAVTAAFSIQGTTDGHGNKIIYMTGSSDPWGVGAGNAGSPDAAMDKAFGASAWQKINGFTTNALSSDVKFLYVDGGDGVSTEFNHFVNGHRAELEGFVSSGGHLLINAARWDFETLDLGFGVTLKQGFSSSGAAVNPANVALFNGHAGNAGTSWTGGSFSHDVVSGADLHPLITGTAGVSLADEHFGAGYVMVGGITSPYFQNPQPQADILRADMLYYAANVA